MVGHYASVIFIRLLQRILFELMFILQRNVSVHQVDKRRVNISRFSNCVVQVKSTHSAMLTNEDVIEVPVQVRIVN